MKPNPDHLAFRELLEFAKCDPVLEEQIDLLMREGAPVGEILALRPLLH
ncbi:MAG: hypothetical protein ABIX37_01835 [Gammaproteobacteria bacterium]